MKRFFLLSLLSLFFVTNIMAQGRMEIGANFIPLGKEVIKTNTSRLLYTVGVYGEYRWSLGRHFDAGARLDAQGGRLVISDSFNPDPWTISTDILAVADFNLFPGKTVNPYLGIGVGPGFGMHNNTWDYLWAGSFLAMADARIGMELFQHLRVAVDVKTPVFGDPRYTYLYLNIGWVF